VIDLFDIATVVPTFSDRREILRQVGGGAYDEHGRWEGAPRKSVFIDASVQVKKKKDLIRVEEGRRTKGAIKIYTDTQLQISSVDNSTQPDRIVHKGDEWELESEEDWSEDGEHYKYIAIKANP